MYRSSPSSLPRPIRANFFFSSYARSRMHADFPGLDPFVRISAMLLRLQPNLWSPPTFHPRCSEKKEKEKARERERTKGKSTRHSKDRWIKFPALYRKYSITGWETMAQNFIWPVRLTDYQYRDVFDVWMKREKNEIRGRDKRKSVDRYVVPASL